ncbi:hypothetical protein BGW80DRAFT_603159 [Lactifluus volemus]|nr:hypothetical protein BGW80DRAFT_603159 [Lactifluus volemus]
MVAAPSSTHGNTVGGRVIFPAFSCKGNDGMVITPPNANGTKGFILDGPKSWQGGFVRIDGIPG